MLNDILTATGVPFEDTRYIDPPAGVYGVYMDDITDIDGSDDENLIISHDYTLEVYASTKEESATAEASIEAELNARGIRWTKQARYWLQEEQRYQVIYEFTIIEKR